LPGRKATMAEAWKKYPDLSPRGLEGRIAALKEAVAKAKAIGEQRRQVIEVARKQIYDMAVEIVALSGQLAEESAANDKLLQQQLQQAVLDGERAIEDAKFDAYWKREVIVRWNRRA
jgi:TolA-binding protein